MATLALSDCVPYPIATRLGNVTLQNQQVARGLALSLGTPMQDFAFVPQWPLNNTFVYGQNGFCDTNWTNAACTTWRGGEYDELSSQSRTVPDANAYPIDGDPYPQMNFVADTFQLNDNVSLENFPFGIALSDWGEQGYAAMVALGLGPNSTILNTLKTGGLIASRAWGLFYGLTGAEASAQLDGNFVFGGFDRAKVSGPSYNGSLLAPSALCTTGMLVAITDMTLNFPNGTDTSLFQDVQSAAIQACIVPSFPALMSMPYDPYVENFCTLTGTTIYGFANSVGLDFWNLRYTSDQTPYDGDLTVTLESGLSVRVPNSQLVVPDRTVNSTTGAIAANSTGPDLVIYSNQDVNANDITQLGRQFLSVAYLMVNQDAGQFTLWAANPTANEDLVAVDEQNNIAESLCVGNASSPTITAASASSSSPSSAHLSAGATTAVAVGCVVVGLIVVGALAAAAWCLRRRRRRRQQSARAPAAELAAAATTGNLPQEYYYYGPKPEQQPPAELAAPPGYEFAGTEHSPPYQAAVPPRYELMG